MSVRLSLPSVRVVAGLIGTFVFLYTRGADMDLFIQAFGVYIGVVLFVEIIRVMFLLETHKRKSAENLEKPSN